MMKILNAPLLTIAIALSFGYLGYYSYQHKADDYVTYPEAPAREQPGYDKAQAARLNHFEAQLLKGDENIVTYRQDLADMYNTK